MPLNAALLVLFEVLLGVVKVSEKTILLYEICRHPRSNFFFTL
jgi:hypothetical protein